jgi:hypothetical protein
MIALGFSRVVFVICCALSTVSNSWDLSEEHKPEGALGVRLDYYLATSWPTPLLKKGVQNKRAFAWSRHLKFDTDVSKLDDAQLWQMAYDGYAEMKEDMKLYSVGKKGDQPSAMTVLAVGKEIFLASSMKHSGNFAFEYPPTKVSRILEQCQITFNEAGGEGDAGHKNNADCAEVMSAQMYFTTDQGENTSLKDRNARICTVVWDHKLKKLQNRDPCGDMPVSYIEYTQICGFS